MLQIRKYTPADKAQWDKFVETSRNGTFLFRRDFMDYHADRFADHSLIAEDERGWLAVLPANAAGTAFHSHQGLTYGGFVLSPRAGAGCVMALFDAAGLPPPPGLHRLALQASALHLPPATL